MLNHPGNLPGPGANKDSANPDEPSTPTGLQCKADQPDKVVLGGGNFRRDAGKVAMPIAMPRVNHDGDPSRIGLRVAFTSGRS